jgi:hypothetical protein
MNTTYTTPKVILGVAGLVMALTLVSLPLFADAATYAYVDTTGEVKPVLADTWQQAIAKAVGIHIHSGVMLLDSPADFDIVGNEVSGY